MYDYLAGDLAAAHRSQRRREAEQSQVAAQVPRQGRARPFHADAIDISDVRLRVLTRDDMDHVVSLFERLSPRSRYLRYLAPLRSLSRRQLQALADIDHVNREVVGAFARGALIGMARYVRDPGEPTQAEISVEVADDFHRLGIGERLIRELAHCAQMRGVEQLTASGLRENRAVLALLRRTEWPTRDVP